MIAALLQTFRDRLAHHSRWLAHNAPKIDELSFVIDALAPLVEAEAAEARVARAALREMLRQHRGHVKAVYVCQTWQTNDPLAFYDHAIACELFRAPEIGLCPCGEPFPDVPQSTCCNVQMEPDPQICPKCNDHAIAVLQCGECGRAWDA